MENTNVGYRIISSLEIRGYSIALGHNPSAPAPYVTWEYTDQCEFYWGHYFDTYQKAAVDFCNRILAGIQEKGG